MASTISAGTTSGTAIAIAGDTTGALALQTNGTTTAVTIDTSQNVGIGTSSPSRKLTVYATGSSVPAVITNDQTQARLCFKDSVTALDYTVGIGSIGENLASYTGGTERMRIDSSGNALIGQTSQSGTERLGVTKSVAGGWVGYFLNSSNTSGDGGIRSNLGSNCNNTSSYHFNGLTTGINNWYLYGNGTSSFSSDFRLKKNIETTRDGYLDDVMKLRVVKYNWKNDSENTPRELGLIAQEVEQVFAGLVQDDPNKISEDDDTVYKQLKASVLPMILLKAIQELNAKVDAQALEIQALKGVA